MRMGQQIEIDVNFQGAEIVAVNQHGPLSLRSFGRRGEKWKPEVVLPVEPPRAQGQVDDDDYPA